ncbi:MAG: cation transporter [Nitrospira sp.]|nr:cation transporter [Nitrospira sp.]MCA9474361.1 cation transporter [Nitrospira sp.]MCA9480047.1 cation transporter [Nitrospira sp.]MCB9711278.1 cation transporter [Nitrospiraceae bacterium]MDR4486407.1 cation diffusion facilitator family transporter [Nitrospirales bacterium]
MAAAPSSLIDRLKLGLLLNGIIILAEFIGGWWTNSLGLMSDAGHNLVDQGSLILAFYAHLLASRPATEFRTFGYHRAGTVAAFVNGMILLLTGLGIGIVAGYRLFFPVDVPGFWIMGIAGISALANIGVAILLRQGAHDDINIRGAFLHMVMDAWMSVGVILAGLGIALFHLPFLDPLISLILVIVILKGSWPLFQESLNILLESTPPHLQTSKIVDTLQAIPGVIKVHDLHIWAVEPRIIMLTCHVLVDSVRVPDKDQLMKPIQTTLASTFGIHHMTIQLETECEEEHALHCNLNHLTQTSSVHPPLPHAHHH